MSVDISQLMLGPRLKVERARRHLDELIRRSSPLDRALYDIIVVKISDANRDDRASQYDLVYYPRQRIPETFALIIGDVVHNLRAALDHLANGIITAWHPRPPDRPFFPMASKREHLVAHKFLPSIETALPGARDLLLHKIRPANGSNESLWAFHAVDNDDKHNLILPTVTITSINNINARIGTKGAGVADCGVSGEAMRPMVILTAFEQITIQQGFDTAVHLAFGEGSPFDYQPVVPTLLQIAGVVTETLDAFEHHIQETKL